MAAATRAITSDRNAGIAHVLKGVLTALMADENRLNDALESVRRGHELNPHETTSLIGLAFVENMAGNSELAIGHLQHALRVSPRDPLRPILDQQLAMSCFGARRYSEGVASALHGLSEAPRLPPLYAYLAANYVGLGDLEKATAAMAAARRVGPEFVASVCSRMASRTTHARIATA